MANEKTPPDVSRRQFVGTVAAGALEGLLVDRPGDRPRHPCHRPQNARRERGRPRSRRRRQRRRAGHRSGIAGAVSYFRMPA